MHFIPNPSNTDFVYLLGLETVVDYLTVNKKANAVAAPFRCAQCKIDFTPVWKWEKQSEYSMEYCLEEEVYSFITLIYHSQQGCQGDLRTVRNVECEEGTEGGAYQSTEAGVCEGTAAGAGDRTALGQPEQSIARRCTYGGFKCHKCCSYRIQCCCRHSIASAGIAA